MPDIQLGSTTVLSTNASSPLAIPFTNPAGAFVVVDIQTSAATADDVTAVTYAGIPMARIGEWSVPAGINFSRWILNNAPVGGTFTVLVTFTTPSSNMGFNIASYIGVNSTGQPDNVSVVKLPTSNPTTMPFVPIADRCWVLAAMVDDQGDALTAQANCVVRVANAANFASVDSNGPYVPGNYMGISHVNAGSAIYAVMMSIAPVPPVAALAAKPRLDPQMFTD